MPASPRQLLENRFEQLSADLDAFLAESREQTRREFSEQLNSSVRRLRLATDPDELCATLIDSVARFAAGTLLFRIQDGVARNPRIAIPLKDAPAIASAAEMRDPLVALATPAEISGPLSELLGHDDSTRAHLFPVAAAEPAPALVYAWGTVQGPVIELLTQVAAAVWTSLPVLQPEPEPEPEVVPAPPLELVTIAPAPVVDSAPKTASAWNDLAPAEQQLHLRAQRFARVHVAEMRLQHADRVQTGRSRRDIYAALREPIDAARKAFYAQFFTCPSMVDYLDLELTRTLAHEDPELLGRSYPGPLV
jgi:hypothetical protein